MKRLFVRSYALVCLLAVNAPSAFAQVSPFQYKGEKVATGNKGAVASAHPLASAVGLQILRQGGNAVDAAIAMQLALAVVYPGAGNLGGGGFLVAHLAPRGKEKAKNLAIDYREKAPAAASRDMYLDSAGNPQMNLSQDGHLACGVPGTVAGLFAALPHARLSFRQLVQPAIDLAEQGFAITASEAGSLNYLQKEFIALNTTTPVFVKAAPWKAGDTLIQKDLAATLRRIRDRGAKGFYEGETARLIVAEMKKGKGLITLDDLRTYKAAMRKAVSFDYRGHHIISMPLPSSGGIILQQVLKIIEKYDVTSMGFQSAASVQLLIEAERRAYADRAEFLGDADFVKVPVKTLVSPSYLAARMQDYVPGKAGSSDTTKPGIIKESDETTHLSVTDADGNAVSVTTTLNGSYGSRTVVGGAGFLLNNEMDDFSVKPGVPNMYGAVGAEANAIAPRKRMLSSMTPTVVLKNGQPVIIVGTPGGTTIPTSVIQSIVNLVDFKLSPQDAVNKPKFHHQWLPDEVYIEQDFDSTTAATLRQMGYKLVTFPEIGRVELIEIKKGKRPAITAVADKRGDDAAAAY